MSKKILSLFDYTGAWCRPYHEAGYETIQIDIKHGDDVMDITREWVEKNGPFHGVMVAHPCDEFAGSGSRWYKGKNDDGTTDQAIRLASHSLDIVMWAKPVWWVWENPVGRLNRLFPRMRQYGPKRFPFTGKVYFDPHNFGGWLNPPGDRYHKRTCLWGEFNYPEAKDVEPVVYTASNGKKGSYMWAKLGGKSRRTKELRSITPMGFARAFFAANP